ncbi:MAG: Fur family transcriptional regulator [Eubacteriales bacterium]|jgi:Fur family peroxide stress response transcriptional regulator
MGKKLRHSRQRACILEYLQQSPEHPSAEKVFEDLRPQMPNLSLGTVYRNLKVLEEQGEIRRVLTKQQAERYDGHLSSHPHFVCSKCGCVVDLPAEGMEILLKQAQKAGVGEVQWMDLSFGGLCAACAAENIDTQRKEEVL